RTRVGQAGGGLSAESCARTNPLAPTASRDARPKAPSADLVFKDAMLELSRTQPPAPALCAGRWRARSRKIRLGDSRASGGGALFTAPFSVDQQRLGA